MTDGHSGEQKMPDELRICKMSSGCYKENTDVETIEEKIREIEKEPSMFLVTLSSLALFVALLFFAFLQINASQISTIFLLIAGIIAIFTGIIGQAKMKACKTRKLIKTRTNSYFIFCFQLFQIISTVNMQIFKYNLERKKREMQIEQLRQTHDALVEKKSKIAYLIENLDVIRRYLQCVDKRHLLPKVWQVEQTDPVELILSKQQLLIQELQEEQSILQEFRGMSQL